MPSRLSVYAEKIIEAGWLAVLIVAPLFFNPYSDRVFNLSNVALVRTLALVMLAAWLILRVESATTRTNRTQLTYLDSFTTKTQRLCVLRAFVVRIPSLFRLRILIAFSIWSRGNPLTLLALFLIVAYIISTLASVSPNTSVFGSYDRTQGLYTTFSYILIFFLAASTIRSQGQIARAVNVALVVSFPVAFYGVIQHYALDPLSWPHGASPGRVASTIGNPAFLGAYLILIIPLTLMRLIAQTEQLASHMHSASTARRNYPDSFTTKTQRSQRLGVLVSWWLKHEPFSAALYGGVVVSCVGLAALWGLSFDLGAKSMIGTGSTQMLTPAMLKAAQANFNLALGISVIVLLGWCIAGVLIKRGGNGLLIGVYALLLALQVIGLWFTQSRGPFVGLLGGLFTFVVLYLLVRGVRRSVFGVLGAILALLAFLVLFSSAASSLVPTRDPYMKRLARTFSTEGGTTAQVRALIWEGALRLALPHAPLWSPTTGDDQLNALRPLIGYGPESMYAAYNQFYPPELARVEVRTAKPDRAHNETLDAFVQTGLLGAAAYLLLFSSICYLGCSWLGFIATPRDRNVFIALWLGGGIVLTLIFGFAFGWHFLGVALPAGMLVGFFVYVFAFAGRELWSDAVSPKKLFSRLTTRRSSAVRRAGSNLGEATPLRTPARSILLVTLIAALIGHWLEIQIGVAHTTTRSYFWFFAALLITVGVRQLPEFELTQEASTVQQKSVAGSAEDTPIVHRPSSVVVTGEGFPPTSASMGGSTAALIGFGLFTGLILAIMAFDFVSTQNASVPLAGTRALDVVVASLTSKNTTDGIYPSLAMFWLFAGTMLVALTVGAWEWRNGLVRFDEWLLAIGLLVLTALATFSAFIFYTFFIMSVDSLDALVSTFPYFVLFLLAIVLVSAISLVYEHPLPRAALARRWSWIVVPIASMIGLVLIATTNISIVQADITYKQAPRFALDAEGAITPFQQALAIQPAQEYAFVFLSNAYLAQARESTGPAQRNELLVQAEEALLRAREINPLDSDHTVLLAQLHGTWAALTVVPAEKDNHFRKSLAYYAQATRLSPNAAHFYDQYAQALLDAATFLEQQQDSSGAVEALRNAREQLARALALDPTFCLTFAIRASTQSTWTGTARDALDALNYVPLCRSHGDPFEQQARTLALQSLSSAGERADAAGEGAAYASLLEAEARAHPSVDLYMTLAEYYARDGAIEAAIRATEAGIALIPADDQATRQRYVDLADSLRAQRDAGRH